MHRVLFDHIAIAVTRLADAEPILAGQLGGRNAVPLADGAHPVPGAVFRRLPTG